LNGQKKTYLSLAGRVVLAGAQPSDSAGFLIPLDFFHPAVRAWFDQSFISDWQLLGFFAARMDTSRPPSAQINVRLPF
jgi:hypothetical protein